MTSGRKKGDKNKYSDETLEQYCRRAYLYDAETGAFTHAIGPRKGQDAGQTDAKGYRRIQFRRRGVRVHRIAWFLHHGEWPVGIVDHKDRDKSNNRIVNLRDVTSRQNTWNQKARQNQSGFKGVTRASPNRWLARVATANGRVELGYYPSAVEAARAYDAAAIRHHGEFAATNESLGLMRSAA